MAKKRSATRGRASKRLEREALYLVASDEGVVLLDELGVVVLELELGVVVEFMLPADAPVPVEVDELLLGAVDVLLGVDVSVAGVGVL